VSVMEEGISEMEVRLSKAEAAAEDNSDLNTMVGKLFRAIASIEQTNREQGRQTSGVSESAAAMRGVVEELTTSSERAQNAAVKLQRLTGQFQVSAEVA